MNKIIYKGRQIPENLDPSNFYEVGWVLLWVGVGLIGYLTGLFDPVHKFWFVIYIMTLIVMMVIGLGVMWIFRPDRRYVVSVFDGEPYFLLTDKDEHTLEARLVKVEFYFCPKRKNYDSPADSFPRHLGAVISLEGGKKVFLVEYLSRMSRIQKGWKFVDKLPFQDDDQVVSVIGLAEFKRTMRKNPIFAS